MLEGGIACGVHYPAAIHQQRAYGAYRDLSFPHAERACREVVSLPMGAALRDETVREVIRAARHAAERN
jgi:dTDP-4-amino-4,6-dideoxygalactose transaminase